MAISVQDGRPPATRILACKHCEAPLAQDQRYCLECGERRGALPPAVAGLLTKLQFPELAEAAAAGQAEPVPGTGASDGGSGGDSALEGFAMPTPRGRPSP